jgi:hypothetical protein
MDKSKLIGLWVKGWIELDDPPFNAFINGVILDYDDNEVVSILLTNNGVVDIPYKICLQLLTESSTDYLRFLINADKNSPPFDQRQDQID